MENPSRKDMILKMLNEEPDDVFLNYALAMEYLAISDLSGAEAQLKKVVGIDANYLACYYQLGQIKEQQAVNDMAIEYYKKGIELAKAQNNKKALGELHEALQILED